MSYRRGGQGLLCSLHGVLSAVGAVSTRQVVRKWCGSGAEGVCRAQGVRHTTPPPRSVAPSVSSVIHHAISNQRVPPVPPGWREQGRRRLLPPPLPLSTRRPPLPRMRICEALRARPPAVCANDAGSAAVCWLLPSGGLRWEWTPPSLCALSLDESGPPLRSLALSNVRES